ncbi:hypothetical protein K1W69_01625 [Hoeflea sp. WL0058]|uniref:Uncharacterized protein n=1 Tax=Flavimaribacter sediminis TaxID=2865987 RepID=A0AAE2ZM69_9HYPH|nr:hypothetical protein [Flavimaribacter sediminis]MBW8635867.1 hypothetical protein [Flavimaribacter sediminis]
MKVVVEFYRTRDADDLRAVIGQQTMEVADIEDAIETVWKLSTTLDMPQQPDGVSIMDADGAMIYSGAIERLQT